MLATIITALSFAPYDGAAPPPPSPPSPAPPGGLWTYKDQWCVSSLDEGIQGPKTAAECFAACGQKYPDRPNFAEFVLLDEWTFERCYCQDSCGCIGVEKGFSITTAEPFSEMPPTCCSINRKYGVEKCVDNKLVAKTGCVVHTIKDFIDLEREPAAELDCIHTLMYPFTGDCSEAEWLGDTDRSFYNGSALALTRDDLEQVFNRTALHSLREGDSLYWNEVCGREMRPPVEMLFFTSKEDCLAMESPVAANIEPVDTCGHLMEGYFCPEEDKDAPSAGLRRKLHGSSSGSSKLWLGQLEPTASEPLRKHAAVRHEWLARYGGK